MHHFEKPDAKNMPSKKHKRFTKKLDPKKKQKIGKDDSETLKM